ncbi:uncharacterized protein METZ01_LOCUS343364 [marine metagenome]|uniref:Uncharacterized protein n=1 Tax=marine metagenome TaxID=408172 RepID=A0A382R012_9ZZZZ
MPYLWTGFTDPTRQVKALSPKKKIPRGRYGLPAEDDSSRPVTQAEGLAALSV